MGVPIQVKLKKLKKLKKLSPLPYETGECSSSGSPRPGHPHSTPWSCERGKTKLTTQHIMQDSTLCPRQFLHAPLLCRGALCRVSHQPGKHPLYKVLGCEGGRVTRMAPDATTEKIRDKNKSRFNSRQAVRSNPFVSKEAPSGVKSMQQNNDDVIITLVKH